MTLERLKSKEVCRYFVRLITGCSVLVMLMAPTLAGASAAEGDIVIADFESEIYPPGWKTEGEAFGTGPAVGNSPQLFQQGNRYIHSNHKGDSATGTLTSSEFEIQRDYINSLVGGGYDPGNLRIDLLIDGKWVFSETGRTSNHFPGTARKEFLDWKHWDVKKYKGEKAVIRIVDEAAGRDWAHICVDQIVQSNMPKMEIYFQNDDLVEIASAPELPINGKYLHIPVSNNKIKETTLVGVFIDGKLIWHIDVELATSKDDIDWWTALDMSEHVGKTARIITKAPDDIRNMITTSDEIVSIQPLYDEALRPQLRFSAMRGWSSDANGMVYYDGEYHLLWQSCPASTKAAGGVWRHTYWGHAVSTDLLHWEELPHALRTLGGLIQNRDSNIGFGDCFSGSGNVDIYNTAGWQTGKEKTMVFAVTNTFGESIAYSNDRGRTWTIYDEPTPIRISNAKYGGNDSKLVWYEPGKHWVIARFDHLGDPSTRGIAFYTSKDLKSWTRQSRILGFHECPELFEIPVDGDASNIRWILWGGNARYMVGKFDGKSFRPEHEGKYQFDWGNRLYASQCFSNTPDGRVIQIGWGKVDTPGMPFNQTFSLPTHLTLRSTEDGPRLFGNPIKELQQLRKPNPVKITGKELTANESQVESNVEGQLFDIILTLKKGTASKVFLRFGENQVVYDFTTEHLDGIPLKMKEGKITMRVVVDRPMFELFGGGGACCKLYARGDDAGKPVGKISVRAEGGTATIESLKIFEMKSIWK